MPLLKTLIAGLADLLFPRNCLLCHRYLNWVDPQLGLCQACLTQIEPLPVPCCLKCSGPTSRWRSGCRQCAGQAYDFDQTLSAVFYNDCMRRLLHSFKYGQKTSLAFLFQSLLLNRLEQNPLYLNGIEVIIPVPLYPTRFRERGYNQAEILARGISQATQIPVNCKILLRQRPTRNQAAIGRKDRWTNIRGAFRINHSWDLKEKSILIVDDLLTTGTTASEAARILKDAGAKKVKILTLAAAV